jgi:aryl-alcohol dehydrogenase-like predicted oxidoreductase
VGRSSATTTAVSTVALEKRRIGSLEVSVVGLGCNNFGRRLDSDATSAVVNAALDAGINFLDTADTYGATKSEEFIGRALRGRRDNVILATKFGSVIDDKHKGAKPDYVHRACEDSLRRLATDRIDLYQLHRPDENVPYAESVGALKELQDEGKVRWVGLSNADGEQLEQALGIVEVVSLQNQLSLDYTGPLAKGEVQLATERDIAFLPWSPLGGIGSADEAGGVSPVRDAAERHGVSPQRVALAWLLSLSPRVIPIPGASRPETITDSLAAAELVLDAAELQAITAAVV